ncbi:hypothetical protein OH767_49755 [Streptomyces sp. NBC_01614]|uniref:Uncharacterized protein n=1 Tax=Streptomyces sp. NBC_00180 TaxID=2903632 RepID=A0AAU1IBV7_9ACTN
MTDNGFTDPTVSGIGTDVDIGWLASPRKIAHTFTFPALPLNAFDATEAFPSEAIEALAKDPSTLSDVEKKTRPVGI